jgi:formylglycine-generating enzyme
MVEGCLRSFFLKRCVTWICAAFGLAGVFASAFGAAPVVSNIRASQRPGTHFVDIYYNVSDSDGSGPLTIYVAVSDNGGASYGVPVFTITGAVGPGVTTGNDRHIVWNAGTDWPGRFTSQCRVKIIADDGSAPPAPAGMAYIPPGPFTMGDTFLEDTGAMPVHTVYVSAFFMDKFEVTRELHVEVYSWALGNGYGFSGGSPSKGAGHPVHSIRWHDAVKWCNARSEREGLTPCYYTDATQTTVYRTGSLNLLNTYVKWGANGYRLPTEAEWEKAARGGQNGKRFPWGDTISHSDANYISSAGYSYDLSPTRGTHPAFNDGTQPFTSPADFFPPNAYGLYDLAGNLQEWCWDGFQSTWYAQVGAIADDSPGPDTTQSERVIRGGSWNSASPGCHGRTYSQPSSLNSYTGFRCARRR